MDGPYGSYWRYGTTRSMRSRELRRVALGYGKWVCEDGREVIYNRFYKPIWERLASGEVRRSDPKEWVKDIVDHRWFYDDGTPEDEKQRRGGRELFAWGITQQQIIDFIVETTPKTPRSRTKYPFEI